MTLSNLFILMFWGISWHWAICSYYLVLSMTQCLHMNCFLLMYVYLLVQLGGRRAYEPPRYMTINTAIDQLLEIAQACEEAGEFFWTFTSFWAWIPSLDYAFFVCRKWIMLVLIVLIYSSIHIWNLIWILPYLSETYRNKHIFSLFCFQSIMLLNNGSSSRKKEGNQCVFLQYYLFDEDTIFTVIIVSYEFFFSFSLESYRSN